MNVARISAWLPLVALLLTGAFLFREIRLSHRLKGQLATTSQTRDTLQIKLAQAKTHAEAQDQQLQEMDADLGATKTRLSATEARNVQLGRQAVAWEQQVSERDSQIEQLQAQLAAATQDLASARADPASSESVAAYRATITELRQQLAAAQSAPKAPAPAVPVPVLTTSRSRTAAVVSVGPANAFVVLNYGARHGALPHQGFTIQRGTKSLATVLISDVRENYSIAQVQPQSLQGALHKGDSAVLNSTKP